MQSNRRTRSLNVLQMTTLNVKQLTIFDIAYHTRMIYKPIHIENMFWIFVLKQIQFILNPDVSFLGQYRKYSVRVTVYNIICIITVTSYFYTSISFLKKLAVV